mmetsp:Transcript_13109/g.30439  ORF Transcript_13109/g.30439 Transcript_13109/m.30439 type:complete len:85 (-) Transcript_13109:80-334(-)
MRFFFPCTRGGGFPMAHATLAPGSRGAVVDAAIPTALEPPSVERVLGSLTCCPAGVSNTGAGAIPPCPRVVEGGFSNVFLASPS